MRADSWVHLCDMNFYEDIEPSFPRNLDMYGLYVY